MSPKKGVANLTKVHQLMINSLEMPIPKHQYPRKAYDTDGPFLPCLLASALMAKYGHVARGERQVCLSIKQLGANLDRHFQLK